MVVTVFVITVITMLVLGGDYLPPPRGATCFVLVESPCPEDSLRIDDTVGRPDDIYSGMERSDDTLYLFALLVRDEIALVEDENVTELGLLGEQIREWASTVFGRVERLAENERLVELVSIDDGDGRVEVI